MTVFTRTWNTAYIAQPADTEDLDLGASRIRELKNDIKERLEVDHSWAGDEFDGEHTKITLFAPLGSDPATVANKGHLYGKDISSKIELFWKDEDGNVVQLTSAGNLNQFPSGTRMLFQQTSAPTGWTKDTTDVNDKSLRIISGTVGSGGTNAFSAAFNTLINTEGHALTIDEMPAHGHPWMAKSSSENQTNSADGDGPFITKSDGTSPNITNSAYDGTPSNVSGRALGGSGGGSSHLHGLNLDVQYLDAIIAVKD